MQPAISHGHFEGHVEFDSLVHDVGLGRAVDFNAHAVHAVFLPDFAALRFAEIDEFQFDPAGVFGGQILEKGFGRHLTAGGLIDVGDDADFGGSGPAHGTAEYAKHRQREANHGHAFHHLDSVGWVSATRPSRI